MEINFEEFRNKFRSFSNSMLSDYDHDHVKTDEDRMMIILFGEILDGAWRHDELMKKCYKEYLRNRNEL